MGWYINVNDYKMKDINGKETHSVDLPIDIKQWETKDSNEVTEVYFDEEGIINFVKDLGYTVKRKRI